MKKSKLKKIWKWLLPIPAIILGAGGYLTYNTISNKDKKDISGDKSDIKSITWLSNNVVVKYNEIEFDN